MPENPPPGKAARREPIRWKLHFQRLWRRAILYMAGRIVARLAAAEISGQQSRPFCL